VAILLKILVKGIQRSNDKAPQLQEFGRNKHFASYRSNQKSKKIASSKNVTNYAVLISMLVAFGDAVR